MVEEWKWIKGYEGRYSISNMGRLKSYLSDKNGKILSLKNQYGWYFTINLLDDNGKRNTKRIHILVAEHFIGEIPKGYHVHHKDGNKQNNKVNNLEIIHPIKHYQETYLFLTKNPKRYESLLNRYMPPNMWFGWSQTEPMGDNSIFETHHSVKTFVSIEPILKPFTEFHMKGIDWVIIGAETGNRKSKVVPERKWIEDIVYECKKHSTPVFMKSNLKDIWDEPLIQEFPKELKKEKNE